MLAEAVQQMLGEDWVEKEPEGAEEARLVLSEEEEGLRFWPGAEQELEAAHLVREEPWEEAVVVAQDL